MFETQQLIEIISRQRHDPLAMLLRFGLGLLTPLYRLAIWWRNRRFDEDSQRDPATLTKRVAVPVISIGNLTTGGTGKTPLVIWITRFLKNQDLRVAVISRGYGADNSNPSDTRNDEAKEMELRLPNVPQLQDPDRYRVATIAVEKLKSQVILLDDGFQHRQLWRDLDIVLIDGINPFGYDRLLPRGLLREPLSSLQRADVIVLTRCNLVSNEKKTAIFERIKRHATNALLVQAGTSPTGWRQFDGQEFPLKHLRGREVFGFCGIGNPDGFRQTLQRLQMEPKHFQVFADHHHYTSAELAKIAESARQTGASALVCTHKDLVKVGCNEIGGLPIYALLIEVELLHGQREFETQLLSVIPT